jgi:hypothetical protein
MTHPKTIKADTYQPTQWEAVNGSRRYSLSKNGLGQWWPELEVRVEGDRWCRIIIRDSNPFKSLSGAIRFVEKFIARDVSNGFVFKSED